MTPPLPGDHPVPARRPCQTRSLTIQGFYRLTPESADVLAGLVDSAAPAGTA
ncbi:hypothetical protein [Streptomyces sp. NPDC020917]|uniref:hypothetical protein n=1 Tax=Streptomyces sp. NPDC020917 TaxID=3365102 RepID=UPI0037A63EFA